MRAIAKKLSLLIGFCLCIVLLGSSGIEAAKPAEGQAEITADTIDYDENRGEVRLLGNVKICYEGAVLTASFARYLTKKQEADLQGHVKAVYADTVATGSQMIADFSKHQVQLRGQARLVDRRPGENKAWHTASISAETITYNWLEQQAAALGTVAVEREGRKAYAESAEYDAVNRKITMKGNVRFEQGPNEWLMSERVVIDLTSRKVEAQGRVSGRFIIGAGSTKANKKQDAEEDLPEAAPIEPALQTQTVEEVRALLLPGLQE
ncbi:MAG: LptA/OstA family protein [bacterium]|nr:LptA/OstA family protein [bacterium]